MATENTDRYRPTYIGGFEMPYCTDCGAAVANPPVHNRWHDRLDMQNSGMSTMFLTEEAPQ